MAAYKYSQYLNHRADALFDQTFSPGTPTPHSGIYGCEVCNDEIASNKGNPLPSQNHKQHPYPHSSIKWRLRVASIYT